MTSPADFYAKAVASAPPPTMEVGASGYFSAPQETLDPRLFDGDKLREEVRRFILDALFQELLSLGLNSPGAWTKVWLAGSGISYQWAADRGNGDLDVLFGVDYPTFLQRNSDWGGMSEDQFATWLNTHLKDELWPKTASKFFGQQAYEVTFYLNPGTGRDIRNINPYAAYDVRANNWTVPPPKVSANPREMYPKAWFTAAESDRRMTQELLSRYGDLKSSLGMAQPGSAAWHNYGDALRVVSQQAQILWDDIHGGRHEAFREGGHGYGDYHNFRWQRAKETGVVQSLQAILGVRKAATEAMDSELYGGPIAPADEALSRAAMVSRTRPGMP